MFFMAIPLPISTAAGSNPSRTPAASCSKPAYSRLRPSVALFRCCTNRRPVARRAVPLPAGSTLSSQRSPTSPNTDEERAPTPRRRLPTRTHHGYPRSSGSLCPVDERPLSDGHQRRGRCAQVAVRGSAAQGKVRGADGGFGAALTVGGSDIAPTCSPGDSDGCRSVGCAVIMLEDRRDECARLDGLVEDARAGRSGVLVVRGDAGVGKTALLEWAVGSAPDLRVLRVVGVESERELAFAALHQLCAPLLDRLALLPDPQRRALEVVFGLSDGGAPDRFLVGLAVLSLLSDVSEDRPLVCVIDDAQWLDQASAQTLAFAARRLSADAFVLLFSAREPRRELVGLPELVIVGLGAGDAGKLLRSVVPGPLDERIR